MMSASCTGQLLGSEANVVSGLVSVCVVTHNTAPLLLDCLRSIVADAADVCDLEVIVVDNDSNDGTGEMIQAFLPNAKYFLNRPGVGFTRGINQAFCNSCGEFILITTPGTRALPGALRALLEVLQSRPDVGLVGPSTFNADGTPQYTSKRFPSPSIALLRSLEIVGTCGANPCTGLPFFAQLRKYGAH
jgi:GT2 family glycosyltransferase